MAKKTVRLARLAVGGLASTLLVLLLADLHVGRAARGRVYSDLARVPAGEVALVLGCSPYVVGGRQNLYFQARMEAAAELLAAGKVRYLLLSGDNRTMRYNEPEQMRRALRKLGVPEEAIYLDYAGRRTLDSVVRAREVFGLHHVTIVSQRFHNERALFLAAATGLDAVAYDAGPVRGVAALRTRGREVLARAKACADVYVLGTRPDLLGDPVRIGSREPAARS